MLHIGLTLNRTQPDLSGARFLLLRLYQISKDSFTFFAMTKTAGAEGGNSCHKNNKIAIRRSQKLPK